MRGGEVGEHVMRCRFFLILPAAAHELVALSPEQALPVAVVWLKR
jgi:hypothetical protein